MQRRGKADARARTIDRIERRADCGGGADRAGQETRGEPSGQPMAVALQGEKHCAGDGGQHQPDHEILVSDAAREVRGAARQDHEAERDVGDLRQHLGGHIDDHRGEGERRRNAVQDRRARAEHDSAELGKRQHFRGRIPHHPRPDEDPQTGARRSGQQYVPGGTRGAGTAPRLQAEDRKTAPADRDGGREHGAQADIRDEVKGEASPRAAMMTMRIFTTERQRAASRAPIA